VIEVGGQRWLVAGYGPANWVLNTGVLFWGLASVELEEALELYATRAEAEQALRAVLADEPAWEQLLFITPIELVCPANRASLN
jgi:hypothetical protein